MIHVKLKKTLFKNNSNCVFENNVFGDINESIYNININDIKSNNEIDYTLRLSNDFADIVLPQNKILKSSEMRTVRINEYIEKLIYISNKYGYKPICRMYGNYTALSTIQQKSDTSDLAQLELEENRLIKEFIKNNFEVRVIVSLDIKAIFENALYTEEQYIERSENLVFYLKSIMNNTNLKIAFDDENILNSVYILDTLLMCNVQNKYLDSKEKNYKNTVLNSTLSEIIYEIERFDKRFYELRIYNDITKKALGIEVSKDYALLDKIYKSRLDVYKGRL